MRLLAAAVLTLASIGTALVATAPAQAADTGNLHVTVLDEHGDPMLGGIYYVGSTGIVNQTTAVADNTMPLAPGSYGVMSLSPWGGMICGGLVACDYSALVGTGTSVTGEVQVVAGQTTDVVLRSATPVTLHGPARVGKDLAVTFSPGMQNLLDYFGAVGGGGIYTPVATWTRDGTPIAGADSYDYVPTAKDAGHDLAATLAYTGVAAAQFQYLTGEVPATQQTASVAVGKIPTKSFVFLPRATVAAGQRGGLRVEVTADDAIVTGKVAIAVGSWKVTKPLRNGAVRLQLPAMKPGSYDVTASYLGGAAYAGSKAKPRTYTVKR